MFFIFIQRSLKLLQITRIYMFYFSKNSDLEELKSNYQSNIIKKRLKIIFYIYYFFLRRRIKSLNCLIQKNTIIYSYLLSCTLFP